MPSVEVALSATGKPVHATNAMGRAVCGAKLAKRDGYCQSTILFQNGRCKKHGGTIPSGIMHPAFKGGRGTVMLKNLPHNLHKAFMASLNDPDQISMESEIALMDSRISALLGQLKEKTGGRVLHRLDNVLPVMEALLHDSEPDIYELRDEFEKLNAIVVAGQDEELIWEQLAVNLELRRRLTETDQKRKYQLSKVLQAKEVDTLVYTILTIIRRLEPDVKIRSAIGREVLALVMPKEAAVVSVVADELAAAEEEVATGLQVEGPS